VSQAVKSFGVKEQSRLSSEIDRHVEEIRIVGYTLLPDVLSASELEQARAAMEAIYQQQVEEIGGRDQLAAIGDTYTAMCLLAYDEFFLGLAAHPRVMPIVERLLGDYYTLMLQNGIFNVPDVGDDQTAGYWHRDLGYQHFVSSRPVGVTALYCIDDFSAETGGTYILPATHKTEAFPSEEFVLTNQRGLCAPAGSVVVFDSMLYHRGGHNSSSGVRRAINNIYTLPLIKQQISLPSILGGRHSEDPFLAKLLGYESETDANVIEFRKKRLRRRAAPGY
jgi:ectoine hydroxylase-related dioxygenase (phytanoyl-CoA dioxygenase family)